MSRNSRNTDSRGMNRNTGRHRQAGPLAPVTGISGRFPAKGAAGRRGNTGPGMQYYSRSHYAATGAASLPRRAGRRY